MDSLPDKSETASAREERLEQARLADRMRKLEADLAQSEERYHTLVDLMHQGLVIFSPDGRIDFANETLAEMLGCALSDIVGRPATDFIRAGDHAYFTATLAARRDGVAEAYEITLRRTDGRQVCVMASPSPIVGRDGDFQGSLEVFTDTTRLRQLEAQLATAKRLEAIGHLAGGVAHEINTPLQYVAGNLDFIKINLDRVLKLLDIYAAALDQAGDAPAMEAARREIEDYRREHDLETVVAELPQALEESLAGVERVAGFVHSIKRFARAESLGRQAIDVNEAIRATVEIAKSAQSHPVRLELHLAGDLPLLPCVPGDFNQLLLCLIVNAMQAMERSDRDDGCVRIDSRQEAQTVVIDISDQGPGIPPEIQDKIFNPFYTTRDVGQGVGQGLSIVLSIIEKHKGTIHFVTTPGQGTTFQVGFPLE